MRTSCAWSASPPPRIRAPVGREGAVSSGAYRGTGRILLRPAAREVMVGLFCFSLGGIVVVDGVWKRGLNLVMSDGRQGMKPISAKAPLSWAFFTPSGS